MKNPEMGRDDPEEQKGSATEESSVEKLDQREREIKELHDKYHPEVIFMTQTSATLPGWAIKELWKNVWPEEKPPKILTINTREIQDTHGKEEISKEDPAYEKLNNKNREILLNRIRYLKEVLDEKVYGEHGQRTRDKYQTELRFLEETKENPFSIKYDKMALPSGFSLQLSNEEWPEFKRLKNHVKNKLKKYKITENIAIIDENAGYRKATERGILPLAWQESNENVYEPQRGETYDRNSSTLGLAKQILDSTKKELGIESKVVVLGLDPSGDTASREAGSPWSRYLDGWTGGERLPNGKYRRVKTGSEEGKYVKERIGKFKQLGVKTGAKIKSSSKK